jgi:cell division septum initiation protein DivIVA
MSKQPTTMREATSMVKERLLDRRVDKLSKENDRLRDEVDDLRHELDEAQDRSKETLAAFSKMKRRPGRMKWLVLAGGAYVLGAKAGRARYEQLRGWARSMVQRDGEATATSTTTTATEVPPIQA